MNHVAIIGRLTKDPEIRYTQEQMAIARFTLAVDRRYKKDGEQSADFIPCIAFRKTAEFIEKYVQKGTKLAAEGRIQTGSYEKDGKRVYTTDVVVDSVEFAESKQSDSLAPKAEQKNAPDLDGFMQIPDDIDSELPFL